MALRVVNEQLTGVCAHVLLETWSVLTRLPSPHRVAGSVATDLLTGLEVPVVGLSAAGHLALLGRIGDSPVRGGAAYDALVGATAAEHGLDLVSMDRRAMAAYEAVGVRVVLL